MSRFGHEYLRPDVEILESLSTIQVAVNVDASRYVITVIISVALAPKLDNLNWGGLENDVSV